MQWADEACKTVSFVELKTSSRIGVVIEKDFAHISDMLQGKTYFVFDLNGRIIQKGVAGEIIRLPACPAILKIGNYFVKK